MSEGYKPEYDRSQSGQVPATEVAKFHQTADTDSSQDAIHHTLGSKHDAAAAGDHKHIVGSPYTKPLAGVTISGSRGGNAAVASIIDALEKLGATDSTTA